MHGKLIRVWRLNKMWEPEEWRNRLCLCAAGDLIGWCLAVTGDGVRVGGVAEPERLCAAGVHLSERGGQPRRCRIMFAEIDVASTNAQETETISSKEDCGGFFALGTLDVRGKRRRRWVLRTCSRREGERRWVLCTCSRREGERAGANGFWLSLRLLLCLETVDVRVVWLSIELQFFPQRM